ncbi:3-deoxy-D-manno-octulosonic acid transferase, partial [Acinetobacter baumannii]
LATITGNLKFDMALPADKLALGQQWKTVLSNRRIWLCASTREGEEALILQAWRHEPRPDDILLLIVPRHPQRFDEVAQLIDSEGLTLTRRSD